MVASQTAAREGIPNQPDEQSMIELRRTCEVLELVRDLLGAKPILISSGYRGPQLNAAIGGSTTSQHMTGQAADFTCPGFGSVTEICHAIMKSSIPYDQLIHEYDSWVHISQAGIGKKGRRQNLTINNSGTTSGIA